MRSTALGAMKNTREIQEMAPALRELTELDRSQMCVTEAACGVEGVLAKGAGWSSGGEQLLRAGQGRQSARHGRAAAR